MMDDGGGNDVFVYMGGDHRVPRDVTHAIVDRSVDTIRQRAFYNRRNLVSVEMHDGVKLIEEYAFALCTSLKRIKLLGVRVIEDRAFFYCEALEEVEFGDKLETIGERAFYRTSLRTIKVPKVRVIVLCAFGNCGQLTDVELSEDLEGIGNGAFRECPLRRIAIPLKDNLIARFAFRECDNLSTVDLVGEIHKTISSLPLDRWRNEMNNEINLINRDLPNTHRKTRTIRRWMGRVLKRMEHYTSEHYALLKDNMVLLELALWKANLPSVDAAASRHDARVICGANIIIPHVLSFLNDHDAFPLLRYDLATLRDWINS